MCLSNIFDGVVCACCGCNAWCNDCEVRLCKSSKLDDEVMTVNPLALAFRLIGIDSAGDGVSGLGGELRQRTCGDIMMTKVVYQYREDGCAMVVK